MSKCLLENYTKSSRKQIPKKHRFYVAYKGDEIICSGTPMEISEKLGIAYDHVMWLTTPTARKREDVYIKKNEKSNRMVLIEG